MLFSGKFVEKLLDFCYKGVTTIEKEDEVMFLSILTDLEIGSSNIIEVVGINIIKQILNLSIEQYLQQYRLIPHRQNLMLYSWI
jgi:hypothetical protein